MGGRSHGWAMRSSHVPGRESRRAISFQRWDLGVTFTKCLCSVLMFSESTGCLSAGRRQCSFHSCLFSSRPFERPWVQRHTRQPALPSPRCPVPSQPPLLWSGGTSYTAPSALTRTLDTGMINTNFQMKNRRPRVVESLSVGHTESKQLYWDSSPDAPGSKGWALCCGFLGAPGSMCRARPHPSRGPWGSYTACLSLSLPACKMGVITWPLQA